MGDRAAVSYVLLPWPSASDEERVSGRTVWLIASVIVVSITASVIGYAWYGGAPSQSGEDELSTTARIAAEWNAYLPPLQKSRLVALDLINEDRKNHGLPPVVLGFNPAAQMHAEDMLANDYLGHWWSDGRKPYMVYTETGGTSYAHENAAAEGWTEREWTAENCDSSTVSCRTSTVSEAIHKLQRLMVYDDAHRDNVLGKTHRAVNIGIATNGRRVTFVQHFEGGDVVATMRPAISDDGVLSFSLSKIADGIVIAPVVSIYFDPPPTPKTPDQFERLFSYCVGGGLAEECPEPVAKVLKPTGSGFRSDVIHSTGDSTDDTSVWVADEWTETPTEFDFSVLLGSLVETRGVYTVVVWRYSPDNLPTEVLVELSVTNHGPDRHPRTPNCSWGRYPVPNPWYKSGHPMRRTLIPACL